MKILVSEKLQSVFINMLISLLKNPYYFSIRYVIETLMLSFEIQIYVMDPDQGQLL